jgi:hypothetical protein
VTRIKQRGNHGYMEELPRTTKTELIYSVEILYIYIYISVNSNLKENMIMLPILSQSLLDRVIQGYS